jgi:putative oxidoreductase
MHKHHQIGPRVISRTGAQHSSARGTPSRTRAIDDDLIHDPDQTGPETISRTGAEHSSAHGYETARGSRVPASLLMAGRALFGGYFVYNAFNHFTNHEMMTGYARSKGIPMPDVAVAGSGVLLLLGGLSLLSGAKPKVGASLIMTFLLGVSPLMHAFWKADNEQERMADMINFTKNMALIGGALFAGAIPEPWPVSVPATRV